MRTFARGVQLTVVATAVLGVAVLAGGPRAYAQITGLTLDNSSSSGSVSVGTAQNICTTSVLGTTAPLGGNIGESRNLLSVSSSSPTGFTTRFVADLCTDSGGSTVTSTLTFSCSPGGNSQSLSAQPRINFGVNAPSGTTYRLSVTNSISGEVDFNNDGGGAATGTMSTISTTQTGGIQFGGGNLNLTNAPLPINATAGSIAVGQTSPVVVFTNTGTGSAVSHQVASSWSASCSTPNNGQECGIRIGLGCSITGGAAVVGDTTFGPGGVYPGSPARNQATDGQFVTVGLEFCGDGVIQQDGVLNEQCDNGLDPTTGNGGSVSCCTTNCQVKSSGTPCREAAGECDVTDVCTGTSAACPADLKKANNTPCTDDGNPCSKDICNGVANTCQHPAGNPGAVCRGSINLDCDPQELCTGASTSCPPDVHRPNGFLCSSDGNPCTQDVCDNATGLCEHPAGNPGTVCRQANGDCDAAETCTGSDTSCPADAVQPLNTACPDDGQLCTHDVCDGVSKTCTHPAANAGEVCRPAAGDGTCDFDEVCDGANPNCPADVIETRQVRCRDEQGACDLPEYCTGTNPLCPPDAKQTPGFVCRPAIGGADGACDIAETCDGVTNTCPPDGLKPVGTVCRAQNGPCDAAEVCDANRRCAGNPGTTCTQDADCGIGGICAAPCPVDVLADSSVVCREPAGACDKAEYCTGTDNVCPFDEKFDPGTLCRDFAPGSDCDVQEFCDGSSNDCPADGFVPSTQPCRLIAGDCDLQENCTGTGPNCPADSFKGNETLCRSSAGICDVPEVCSGSAADCPTDQFEPSTKECRGVDDQNLSTRDCDVAELCTGTDSACPPDAHMPDGTQCVGSDPNPNTCLNGCVTGVCTDACPGHGDIHDAGCPAVPAAVVPLCCGNGTVDAGEQCDDGNQVSGDTCPSLPSDDCQIGATGTLIRGDKRNPTLNKTGCEVEYSVLNPNAKPDKFGLPNMIQICEDQDPTCDLDPRPGRCRFHVVTCLNNIDPNLPMCNDLAHGGPQGVNSLKIINRPYLRKSSPQVTLVGQNIATLTDSLQALYDPAHPELGFSLSPPVASSQVGLCTGGMLIDVYAGSASPRISQTSAQRFVIKSKNNRLPRNQRDTSTLYLQCTARPLP